MYSYFIFHIWSHLGKFLLSLFSLCLSSLANSLHNPTWNKWNVVGFSNQLETRWLADSNLNGTKWKKYKFWNLIPRGGPRSWHLPDYCVNIGKLITSILFLFLPQHCTPLKSILNQIHHVPNSQQCNITGSQRMLLFYFLDYGWTL